MEIRSDWTQVFLVKMMLPAMLLTMFFALWEGSTVLGKVVCIAIFGFPGIFCASLAVIRVSGSSVRYARLIGWTTVERTDVVASGLFSATIGWLKLERYVLPWGRVFFVLDGERKTRAFSKPEHPVLDVLRSPGEPLPRSRARRVAVRRSTPVLAFLAGSLAGLALWWFGGGIAPDAGSDRDSTAPFAIFLPPFRLESVAACMALWAIILVRNPRGEYAPLVAFMIGLVLFSLVSWIL